VIIDCLDGEKEEIRKKMWFIGSNWKYLNLQDIHSCFKTIYFILLYKDFCLFWGFMHSICIK